eukprot:Hpha_TRINITY_DN15749_c0_g1::TRINITY_DN15749_c0_g1_i5::g.40933::m.40933
MSQRPWRCSVCGRVNMPYAVACDACWAKRGDRRAASPRGSSRGAQGGYINGGGLARTAPVPLAIGSEVDDSHADLELSFCIPVKTPADRNSQGAPLGAPTSASANSPRKKAGRNLVCSDGRIGDGTVTTDPPAGELKGHLEVDQIVGNRLFGTQPGGGGMELSPHQPALEDVSSKGGNAARVSSPGEVRVPQVPEAASGSSEGKFAPSGRQRDREAKRQPLPHSPSLSPRRGTLLSSAEGKTTLDGNHLDHSTGHSPKNGGGGQGAVTRAPFHEDSDPGSRMCDRQMGVVVPSPSSPLSSPKELSPAHPTTRAAVTLPEGSTKGSKAAPPTCGHEGEGPSPWPSPPAGWQGRQSSGAKSQDASPGDCNDHPSGHISRRGRKSQQGTRSEGTPSNAAVGFPPVAAEGGAVPREKEEEGLKGSRAASAPATKRFQGAADAAERGAKGEPFVSTLAPDEAPEHRARMRQAADGQYRPPLQLAHSSPPVKSESRVPRKNESAAVAKTQGNGPLEDRSDLPTPAHKPRGLGLEQTQDADPGHFDPSAHPGNPTGHAASADKQRSGPTINASKRRDRDAKVREKGSITAPTTCGHEGEGASPWPSAPGWQGRQSSGGHDAGPVCLAGVRTSPGAGAEGAVPIHASVPQARRATSVPADTKNVVPPPRPVSAASQGRMQDLYVCAPSEGEDPWTGIPRSRPPPNPPLTPTEGTPPRHWTDHSTPPGAAHSSPGQAPKSGPPNAEGGGSVRRGSRAVSAKRVASPRALCVSAGSQGRHGGVAFQVGNPRLGTPEPECSPGSLGSSDEPQPPLLTPTEDKPPEAWRDGSSPLGSRGVRPEDRTASGDKRCDRDAKPREKRHKAALSPPGWQGRQSSGAEFQDASPGHHRKDGYTPHGRFPPDSGRGLPFAAPLAPDAIHREHEPTARNAISSSASPFDAPRTAYERPSYVDMPQAQVDRSATHMARRGRSSDSSSSRASGAARAPMQGSAPPIQLPSSKATRELWAGAPDSVVASIDPHPSGGTHGTRNHRQRPPPLAFPPESPSSSGEGRGRQHPAGGGRRRSADRIEKIRSLLGGSVQRVYGHGEDSCPPDPSLLAAREAGRPGVCAPRQGAHPLVARDVVLALRPTVWSPPQLRSILLSQFDWGADIESDADFVAWLCRKVGMECEAEGENVVVTGCSDPWQVASRCAAGLTALPPRAIPRCSRDNENVVGERCRMLDPPSTAQGVTPHTPEAAGLFWAVHTLQGRQHDSPGVVAGAQPNLLEVLSLLERVTHDRSNDARSELAMRFVPQENREEEVSGGLVDWWDRVSAVMLPFLKGCRTTPMLTERFLHESSVGCGAIYAACMMFLHLDPSWMAQWFRVLAVCITDGSPADRLGAAPLLRVTAPLMSLTSHLGSLRTHALNCLRLATAHPETAAALRGTGGAAVVRSLIRPIRALTGALEAASAPQSPVSPRAVAAMCIGESEVTHNPLVEGLRKPFNPGAGSPPASPRRVWVEDDTVAEGLACLLCLETALRTSTLSNVLAQAKEDAEELPSLFIALLEVAHYSNPVALLGEVAGRIISVAGRLLAYGFGHFARPSAVLVGSLARSLRAGSLCWEVTDELPRCIAQVVSKSPELASAASGAVGQLLYAHIQSEIDSDSDPAGSALARKQRLFCATGVNVLCAASKSLCHELSNALSAVGGDFKGPVEFAVTSSNHRWLDQALEVIWSRSPGGKAGAAASLSSILVGGPPCSSRRSQRPCFSRLIPPLPLRRPVRELTCEVKHALLVVLGAPDSHIIMC